MAIKYGKKKQKNITIIYTIITSLILCSILLSVIGYIYIDAEHEASEQLHVQTKQIKDNLQLQLISDRENLITMANFAAKLYSDGESYNIMLDSFKPIGLIDRIGILTPENIFITKDGSEDFNGSLSFEEEKTKDDYISGRMTGISYPDSQVIRTTAPIKVNGETVGMLYGVMTVETINHKYNTMAEELDAQLFVYEKNTGNMIIDTVHDTPDNIYMLKTRNFTNNYSFNEIIDNPNGYTSFISQYTGEEQFAHFSELDRITDWSIMLVRAYPAVFAKATKTIKVLFVSFFGIIGVIVLYILMLMTNEKKRARITQHASAIRKLLLEINQQHKSISEALKDVQNFSKARSSFYIDSDFDNHLYYAPEKADEILQGEDRNFFFQELQKYADELHKINSFSVNVMRIVPNQHLAKTNHRFYNFLKDKNISEVSFASVINNKNQISILGVANPKKSADSRTLLEDVSVCFSIAIYNKKHLHITETQATTDSLTGASNRTTYKEDILYFNKEKPTKFSCIYIDVNELHNINNKYGHAAGDKMLVYVASSLKEIFENQRVYRIGGDEFLVFTQNLEPSEIKDRIDTFTAKLSSAKYHAAIGVAYRIQNTNTEEMIREAETRMYEAKAKYYQMKEAKNLKESKKQNFVQLNTGIPEIDTILSVINKHYFGIYKVSLENNSATSILMPEHLGYNEKENNFSQLIAKYISDNVDSDFHRALTSFLNFDVIAKQLSDGKIPQITYNKLNGESVTLSIYKLTGSKNANTETLWIFSKA